MKKTFWQLKLTEGDEDFHGVVYNGQMYEFTRVCFGNKLSPIIANERMMSYPEGHC